MKQFMLFVSILAVVVLFGGCYIIGQRNELIALDEEVNNAWSNVDADLQRRNDLIPNLVSTVKGYATHEEDVYTKIADARSKLAGSASTKEKAEADAALTEGLGRLLVIAENYPELKANESFLDLQTQLEGTENRIKVARVRYNDKVKVYNRSIRQFPGSLFAGNLPLIGLKLSARDYFEPPQGHDAVVIAPKVEF